MKKRILFTTVLAALTPVLVFAWSASATYYGKLTATSEEPTQGLVYVSTASDTPANSSYGSSSSATNSATAYFTSSTNFTFYAFAKAARGYEFSGWTASSATASTSTGSGDAITVKATSTTSGSPTTGTLTAKWTALTAYTISYLAPASDSYTVSYSYLSVSSSNKLTNASESYSLSPTSDTQTVTSYATDEVILSTSSDKFLGWYEVGDDGTETLISEESTYTYTVSKNATIKAKYISSYTLSYLAPELGSYTVTYSNSEGEETASYNLLPISDTQEVTTYSDEVVTLTATSDNFVGWYTVDGDTETELSTETTCTYTVSADATITAKFSASTANAASVTSDGTTTEYGTLAEAINEANKLSTNPTVTLLRDVYDLTAQQTISKSMTIDLNGHMVVSSAYYTSSSSYYVTLLNINASGIEVTITDSSESGDGQLLMSGTLNRSIYGIQVTKGTLNIKGGKLYVQNKASISSNGSARTYGVLVAAGMTLNMSGGEIETDANRYAWSIYANGSATTSTTVNVSGGTITANADYSTGTAYGILSYSDVNFSGGTINANATTGNTAYGIYVRASANADETKCYHGKLTMTGGTINAYTATTTAIGINIERALNLNGQEINTVSRGEATISDGTINATAGTTTAYGVNTYGPTEISGGTINAITNSTAAYGVRAVDGTTTISGENTTISATATQNAYGVAVAAETSGSTGVSAEGNVVILGGDISATTTSTTNAFGVYVQATSRNITSTASGYYPGYYAAAGSATISGGNISATTATTTAYGVFVGRSMQLDGQEIVAIDRGELTITGGNITATAGTTTAYGVITYGPTEISGGTISATANSTTASGVLVYDNTTTISGDNTTISATATKAAYGVYAYAETSSSTGVKAEGNAVISGGNISAKTTSETTAYGVYVASTSRTIASTSTYSGSYAAAGSASISGGTFSATAATTTAYSVFAAATSTSGTASATPTCAITGGKFAASANSTYANINSTASTDSVTISGGYYTDITNLSRYLVADRYIYDLESSTDEYAEGYRYYISTYQDGADVALNKNTSTKYTTLEAALEASTSGNTVVLINPYKLSTETTVPSGVTLLIPYDSDYTTETTSPTTTETFDRNISAYKTLFMLSGSSITVENGGAICVGGVEYGTSGPDGGTSGAPGCVSGNYGCIDMSAGGTITLESGANLYAWGYIVGQSMSEGDNTNAGSIVAKSGSIVYENFYIGDWHGGGNTYALYSDRSNHKVFPFTQYTTPNIEVPLTIEYGATENVHLYIPTSSMDVEQNCAFFGSSSSFFTMSEGCSVTKRYDPTTDRLHLDINGDMTVNGISIKMGNSSLFSITISSSEFVLPITNNLYVKANSGTLTVPKDMEILPHAVVEIGEGATAEIESNVYVYDLDEWDKYAYGYYYRTYNYRPTSHLSRTATDWAKTDALEDGKLIVDGTMNVSGNLYTTSSGADICSNNAGTINFTAAPTALSNIYQVLGNGATETDYVASASFLTNSYTQYLTQIPVNASWLHNVDDSYTKTAGSDAGTTFNYVDGYWISAAESLTAYTVDDNSGTSKSLTEWQTLQETYPNAIAVYSGDDENVQKLTNVVVYDSDNNAVCTNFVATDKQPIDIPFEFTATTASYSRAATNYSSDLGLQFGTICLPYAVESSDDIQFYSFTSLDGNVMTFTEVTELAANTPALFSVATDADRETVDIIAENATIPVTTEGTVTANGLTLHGVLKAAQTLTANTGSTDYYIAQNKFWRPTTNDVTVNPFRAYFTTDSNSSGVNMFSIAIGDGDEETSVSSVNTDDDEIEGIYSISGMRQSTVQKGINIIRFKSGRTQKVMIK